MKIGNTLLQIKTATWHKDSHGLYDYEENKITTHSKFDMVLQQMFVFLYRKNEDLQIPYSCSNSLSNHPPLEGTLLCAFQLMEAETNTMHIRFYDLAEIEEAERENPQRREGKSTPIYIIVRALKTKDNETLGYRLQPGHILKMGRAQYKITNAQTIKQQKNSRFWGNQRILQVQPQTNDNECRYCMLSDKDFPTPNLQEGFFLCSPCKCLGTCSTVHFNCLQKWNQSKIKKQSISGTTIYSLQRFFCEVCLDQYPRYIKKDDKIHQLMPIQFPKGQHLVLESKEENNNNLIVIQQTQQNDVRIGRGQDAEIRLGDISVSRTHAKIMKMKDGYYVFDNKSKFGTLVQQNPLIMTVENIKQAVQVGRTVITFEKKKNNKNI